MTAPTDKTRLAERMRHIEPFHAMDILARARALAAEGRSIIHMEIGEPDFPTPESVVAAGIDALRAGHTHYTPATGLPALRAAIAAHYAPVPVAPARIVVTPGSSGALQLALAALLNPGDEVLLADPSYPCNRHFVHLFGGTPRLIPVGADTNYQLTAAHVDAHWTPRTRGVMLASPANPTGAVLSPVQLQQIAAEVRRRGGFVIVDEVYHGLVYDAPLTSAVALGEDLFVVNSFSKYYGMTGWRVGWLVAPTAYIPALDRLAQNIFLAANTPAQHAALAALDPALAPELERRRDAFAARRDYLLPALQRLGFHIPRVPRGAFYLYADCSRLCADTAAFAQLLLENTGVAITPGRDFGRYKAQTHARFAYTADRPVLEAAVDRIARFLGR